jgi:hypothetical protein
MIQEKRLLKIPFWGCRPFVFIKKKIQENFHTQKKTPKTVIKR